MAKTDFGKITAQDIKNERNLFFWERGLPYEATNMSQLYSALSTAGVQSVVVAVVEAANPQNAHYYYGYASHIIGARDRAAAIKRVRKYRVLDVSVFQVS